MPDDWSRWFREIATEGIVGELTGALIAAILGWFLIVLWDRRKARAELFKEEAARLLEGARELGELARDRPFNLPAIDRKQFTLWGQIYDWAPQEEVCLRRLLEATHHAMNTSMSDVRDPDGMTNSGGRFHLLEDARNVEILLYKRIHDPKWFRVDKRVCDLHDQGIRAHCSVA